MSPSEGTCLPADCCFSELALFKTKGVVLVWSGHHYLIDVTCSHHNMAKKKCSFGIKQKSLTSNIEGKLFLGYQTNVAQRDMPLKNSLFPGIF